MGVAPTLDGAAVVRFEENALTGWPALRTDLRGGWALRFAGGYSKRANSVHPLYSPQPADTDERILDCEATYLRAGLSPTFKVPGHPAWAPLEATLQSRGYAQLDPSRVLTADLGNLSAPLPAGCEISETFDDRWLGDLFEANDVAPHHRNPARAMAALVDRPLVGRLVSSGVPVAWGYVALVGGQAWVYDIVVSPRIRRQGYGRSLMLGLMGRSRVEGARQACLQVVAANDAANTLYEGLGFTEAYRYSYWRKA